MEIAITRFIIDWFIICRVKVSDPAEFQLAYACLL